MEFSSWIRKFQVSLTSITLAGFAMICVLLGGYVFILQNKELDAQSALHNELRNLREENMQLTGQRQQLERRLEVCQSDRKGELAEDTGTANLETELEQGKQRSFLYTVKKGDTLWDIANMYKVEIEALRRWNNLNSGSRIFPGEQLTIILEEETER